MMEEIKLEQVGKDLSQIIQMVVLSVEILITGKINVQLRTQLEIGAHLEVGMVADPPLPLEGQDPPMVEVVDKAGGKLWQIRMSTVTSSEVRTAIGVSLLITPLVTALLARKLATLTTVYFTVTSISVLE